MTRALVLSWVLVAACAARDASPTPHPSASSNATPQSLYQRGVRWAQRGDMVRAEQYMALAVRAGYPRERALVAIVEACLASSRLRAALTHAEPHLRKHPDAWQVRLLVAAVHAALGRHERAAADLRGVTAVRPDAVDAHHQLAVLLDEQLGDEAGARASFTAYLVHAPEGDHAAEARAWLATHSTTETLRKKR